MLQLFISLLPQVVLRILRYLIFGLGIAVYAQVMFMNGNINSLTGSEYYWKLHPVFSYINMIVWMVIIGICLYLGLKKNTKQKIDKIYIGLATAILLIHISGVGSLVWRAPREAWEYKQYLYDSAEQYALAAEENVIVFVLDAIDNNYVKELLYEKPELFDDFNDFTCYLNTCSVYDQTNESLPQMMTGYKYMAEKDVSGEFYGRLKEAGYTIHFYNYEGWGDFSNINDYIDNFIQHGSIDRVNEIVLKKEMLWNSVQKLTLYQALPCIMKSWIPLKDIDFYHCINIAHFQPFSDYWNEEFDANLNLWMKEDEDKFFVFQHINGTHIPCEDFVDTTAYCLSIMSKMIKQMRELGLYDSATIMIVSDHGYYDSDAGAVYPTAATPMLMIKEKNRTSDNMVLSETPVYHEDILSTLLVNMDLFQPETDYELFGPSIYDFDENSNRTREWYDMELSGGGFRIYQYTGNTEELERVVEEDIFTTVSLDELYDK